MIFNKSPFRKPRILQLAAKAGSFIVSCSALSLFLVLGPVFSCRQTESELGIQLNLVKRKLSNGLTVILVEDHTFPIVSYQTWFRVGSVDETPGLTGISHLFEHLMFKGTPRFGPRQFFQELESRGSEVNAYTTRDFTVYYESFAADLLEKTIDMESDRMAHLILNDTVLANEKLVVLEERRLRLDHSAEGKMQEALWQLAYRRHPYQWPVMGYPVDLLRITTPIVIDYFKSHYQPANAALIVVGDFKADETFKLIKKHYENIPFQPRPKRSIIPEPEQNEERRLTIRGKVVAERFMHAYHISSAADDDSYALDVLANILFEGANSRAYKRLVDGRDITANISGSAYTPTFPGLFLISGTMKANLPSSLAEEELTRLIQKVQDEGVTPAEIQVAVKQLTLQLVDSVRTPHGLGQLIGTVQTVFGDPERFTNDLAKYTRVKTQDVQRVAQKYLQPNNRSVVVLAAPVGKSSP